MSTLNSDLAELARAMRNFLTAVDVRARLSVSEAVMMLDAWHGPDAALQAIHHATLASEEDDPIDQAFWTDVYNAIVDPIPTAYTPVSIH